MRLEFEPNVTAFPLVENELFEDVGHPVMSDFASLLKNGIAAAQSGDREHARSLLTQAADADPRSEDAWMWLASISDYPEELLAFLNHVLEINPENARAAEWHSATRSLLAKTFVQRAVAAHQENALDLVHQCLDQAVAYDSQCEMAWFWKASVADDEAQRFDYLQKVLEINPENKEAAEEGRVIENARSQAIFAAAKAAAVAGKHDEAVALVDEFLGKVQTSAEAWILRSHLSPNMEQKIEALEKALAIDPDNSAARSGYDYFMATFGSAKAAEAVDVNESVEVNETADASESLEVSEAADVSESLELSETADASESLELSETVDVSESLGLSEAVDVSESLELSEAADVSESVEVNEDEIIASQPTEESIHVTDSIVDLELEAVPVAAIDPFESMVEDNVTLDQNVDADIHDTADPEDFAAAETAENFYPPVTETYVTNGHSTDHQMLVDADDFAAPSAYAANGYDDPVSHAVTVDDEPVAEQTVRLAETESAESTDVAAVVSTFDEGTTVPEVETLLADEEHQSTDVAVADDEGESPVATDHASADPYADEPEQTSFETAADPFDIAADAFEAASRDAFASVSDSVEHNPESPVEGPSLADDDDPQIHITDLLQSRTPEEDEQFELPASQSTNDACPFCLSENDSQSFECAKCGAMLTLADIEALLTDRETNRDTIRESVTQMEADWNLREFSEAELTALGVGHLNLGNFEPGLKYLQEASRINPNNVILAAQVNTIAIRLDEIRRQSEIRDAKPKGKTILVVDDSPTVRKLISGKLEKSGHNVICAVDGVEALERLAEALPDLVLLDITMPRMDGYEVCKSIRLNPAAKDLPVVMISGKDGFFDKVRGRMAGTTGYVTKPFGPETLMKALETYLLPEEEINS